MLLSLNHFPNYQSLSSYSDLLPKTFGIYFFLTLISKFFTLQLLRSGNVFSFKYQLQKGLKRVSKSSYQMAHCQLTALVFSHVYGL